MPKLDNRLQAVANFVPMNARVADIGADHGYLALDLLNSKQAEFVVVSDKNSEPLTSARRNLDLFSKNSNKINFRLGGGLTVLKPGEVDTICIAGMGGSLICEILCESPQILSTTSKLILQPMNGFKPLRTWLYKAGWHIVDEELVEVDKKIYVVILSEQGEKNLPNGLELQIGPVILKKYRGRKIFHEHLNEKILIMQKVVSDMSRSALARSSAKYSDLQNEIDELKKILKEDEKISTAENFSINDLPTMIPREVFY